MPDNFPDPYATTSRVDPKDHTVGPKGAGLVAPEPKAIDPNDPLSPANLASNRQTLDSLTDSFHGIASVAREPYQDPSSQFILRRLRDGLRRYGDLVLVAQRRYQRWYARTMLEDSPSLDAPDEMDSAWIIWRSAYSIYFDACLILKLNPSLPAPPETPGE